MRLNHYAHTDTHTIPNFSFKTSEKFREFCAEENFFHFDEILFSMKIFAMYIHTYVLVFRKSKQLKKK